MPFHEIKSKRKTLFVIEQLQTAIKNGEFNVDEKLPPERKIADQMNVSRPLVREAFTALQILGLVETKQGDGTYVRQSFDGKSIISQASDLLQENEDPFSIWEAREVIEPSVASMAATKASQSNLDEMNDALERMKEATEKNGYEEYFSSDYDFHLAIVRATDNPYLLEQLISLLNVMSQPLWQELKRDYFLKEGNLSESFTDHLNIFKAIESGDQKKARDSMDKHFQDLRDCLGD